MTKKESLDKLFNGYLSRNEVNIQNRIKEIGFPIDTIPRMLKAGLIIELNFSGSIHYERTSFSEKPEQDKYVKQLVELFDLVSNEI